MAGKGKGKDGKGKDGKGGTLGCLKGPAAQLLRSAQGKSKDGKGKGKDKGKGKGSKIPPLREVRDVLACRSLGRGPLPISGKKGKATSANKAAKAGPSEPWPGFLGSIGCL